MLKPNVYLAGPWVFGPDTAEIGDRLSRLCEAAGLVPMLPYQEVLGENMDAATIYRENTNRIRAVDAVVADISPFRGPHMDVGTAMEIGYATALGKPVVAYTSSSVALIQRISCKETENAGASRRGLRPSRESDDRHVFGRTCRRGGRGCDQDGSGDSRTPLDLTAHRVMLSTSR